MLKPRVQLNHYLFGFAEFNVDNKYHLFYELKQSGPAFFKQTTIDPDTVIKELIKSFDITNEYLHAESFHVFSIPLVAFDKINDEREWFKKEWITPSSLNKDFCTIITYTNPEFVHSTPCLKIPTEWIEGIPKNEMLEFIDVQHETYTDTL